jgi:bifunctional non-homologous end joining protein LigD
VLPRIHPMRLRTAKAPFDNLDYIFELKHDGFRAVAYFQNGECDLISRKSRSLRFLSLRLALEKLPVRNAIIDGEIVCLDKDGVSQFNWLLNKRKASAAIFYAFDLMWLDGVDLRQTPLLERKARLFELINASASSRLLYAQHINGAGKQFFEEICARDLEGIVAKRKLGIYKDDGNSWLKIKNKSYSQAEGRHELLTRRPIQRNA